MLARALLYAALILSVLATTACARPHQAARLDCRPDPDLLDPHDAASEVTLTVERKGGDLAWTDSNGIEHRITQNESWMWRCAPHREI